MSPQLSGTYDKNLIFPHTFILNGLLIGFITQNVNYIIIEMLMSHLGQKALDTKVGTVHNIGHLCYFFTI